MYVCNLCNRITESNTESCDYCNNNYIRKPGRVSRMMVSSYDHKPSLNGRPMIEPKNLSASYFSENRQKIDTTKNPFE